MTKKLVKGRALYDALIAKLGEAPDAYNQQVVGEPSEKAPCGTAACLGGWGLVLSNLVSQTAVRYMGDWIGDWIVPDIGVKWARLSEFLGIDQEVAENTLFNRNPVNDWPSPYSEDWDKAESNEERAAVAIHLLADLRDLDSQQERDNLLDPDGLFHELESFDEESLEDDED